MRYFTLIFLVGLASCTTAVPSPTKVQNTTTYPNAEKYTSDQRINMMVDLAGPYHACVADAARFYASATPSSTPTEIATASRARCGSGRELAVNGITKLAPADLRYDLIERTDQSVKTLAITIVIQERAKGSGSNEEKRPPSSSRSF